MLPCLFLCMYININLAHRIRINVWFSLFTPIFWFSMINLGKYTIHGSYMTKNDTKPIHPHTLVLDTYKSHRIHGPGIFAYISHKNQPFMQVNIPFFHGSYGNIKGGLWDLVYSSPLGSRIWPEKSKPPNPGFSNLDLFRGWNNPKQTHQTRPFIGVKNHSMYTVYLAPSPPYSHHGQPERV